MTEHDDDRKRHWETVHRSKTPGERSWFQPRPDVSLALIERTGCPRSAPIIDVGGGTSRLVDELLARGFSQLTVLDISAAALDEARARLGGRAGEVCWIEEDITGAELPQAFDLWHDRAVFHFLTETAERRRYVDRLHASLAPGGHLIVATFAEDGPTMCSGLPVVRYSPDALQRELGGELSLVEVVREPHRTPAGNEQRFVYCLFRKREGDRGRD